MPERFGNPTPEPRIIRALDQLAPQVEIGAQGMLTEIGEEFPGTRARETWRADERQSWLYLVGREFDPDGRGIVTNARTGKAGWHAYRLALDLEDAHGRDPSGALLERLIAIAPKYGFAPGALWKKPDGPHFQWALCPVRPSEEDMADFLAGNVDAVIARYGAAA